MPESNDQFRARLHRSGQWEAFGKRRSERLAAGAPLGQSPAIEFGRQDRRRAGGQPAAGDMPLKTRAEYYRDKPATSLGQDARWVYDVIVLDDVQPQDAPSSRAWCLLEWARRNRDDFYRSFVLAAAPIDEPVIQRQQKDMADLL